MDNIKTIKVAVSKIDTIEKLVHTVSSNVDCLESKMKLVDNKVMEMEKRNRLYEQRGGRGQKSTENCKCWSWENDNCTDLGSMLTNIESQNQTLQDRSNHLEWRGLRENMLVYGIKEDKGENCEEVVMDFISSALKIEENISLDREHRKPQKDKIKPIVAKLHYYKQREEALTTSMEKSSLLKTRDQRVGI